MKYEAIHNNMTDEEILKMVFSSFSNGIRIYKAEAPRKYLEGMKLNLDIINAGFNSGQIHHRREEEYLEQLKRVGIITKSPIVPKPQLQAHTIFGRFGIVFPLKDRDDNIVNFYADRFSLHKPFREFLNEKGLYPGFPSNISKKIFITADIYSAATLLQSKVLDNRESVMALFDGKLLEQHMTVLASCQYLQEAILVSCPHEISEFLMNKFPHITVSEIVLAEGTTLNDIWVAHDQETILKLIENRIFLNNPPTAEEHTSILPQSAGLITIAPHKLLYKGEAADYYVQGTLKHDVSSLLVTLKIHIHGGTVVVGKYDLFDPNHRASIGRQCTAQGGNANLIEADIMCLLLLLDTYRDEQIKEQTTAPSSKRITAEIPPARQRDLVDFLMQPNLLSLIDHTLEQTGIIGEEQSRLCAFLIALSYKTNNPLHLIIQSVSGSGKSYLINGVVACMPTEDVMNVTRASGKAFYYAEPDQLMHKVLAIQDMDGLHPEAMLAIRELISLRMLVSLRPHKDKATGTITTIEHTVHACFSSLSATTKPVYTDNLSRSIILSIDQSKQQTERILEYLMKKRAGKIEEQVEHDSRLFLQDMVRMLFSVPVINPYAEHITLPFDNLDMRRLYEMYLSFAAMVTMLHQYQRKKDVQGRLITTKDDMVAAVNLFFPALMIKTDDLGDPNLRQFFDQVQGYVKEKSRDGNCSFTQRELRLALKHSKTHINRCMMDLRSREYIHISGGSSNKGYLYSITHFDDMEQTKKNIKKSLLDQIQGLHSDPY